MCGQIAFDVCVCVPQRNAMLLTAERLEIVDGRRFAEVSRKTLHPDRVFAEERRQVLSIRRSTSSSERFRWVL